MEQQKFFLSRQCFTVLGFAKTTKEKNVFHVFPGARKTHNIICSDEHGLDLTRWIVLMDNPASACHLIGMKEYRAANMNLTIQATNPAEIPDDWLQEFGNFASPMQYPAYPGYPGYPPVSSPGQQANPTNPFPGAQFGNPYPMPSMPLMPNVYGMPPMPAQMPQGDVKPPLPPRIQPPPYESHMFDKTPSAAPPAERDVSKKVPAPSKTKDEMAPEVLYTREEDKDEDTEGDDDEGNEEEEEEETESEEEPEDVNPRMIKVSGLPQNTTKDGIENFFENKRRTGGGPVEEVMYDPDTQTAIVTFEQSDVVNRVLQRLPLLFNKKQIKVEIYRQESVDEEENDGNESDSEAGSHVIEVRGFKDWTSDDALEMYFENTKRSGGSDVLKMSRERDEGVTYLTFESDEVVQRILKKKHKIDGADLTVKKYEPPPPPKPRPMFENRLFLSGINPETTKDTLENFLEAKSGGIAVLEVLYGEEEGTALVTFEENPDFSKLEKACKKKALENCYLRLSRVPKSNCILVESVKMETTLNTLEFYFENKRRSGGDEVTEVKAHGDGKEGMYLVYFEDPSVCDAVCKRSHTVDGQELKVQIYHECLGQTVRHDPGPKFTLPEPIVSKNLDLDKIKFLLKSGPKKEEMEKQMSKLHAEICWPEKATDSLKFTCTMTRETDNWRKLVKSWKGDVKNGCNRFLTMLMKEKFENLEQGWKDVMNGLHNLNVTEPENVSVFPDKKKFEIVIIGYKKAVLDVKRQLAKIIKTVAEDMDRKTKRISESVKLKHHQCLLLSREHFCEKTEAKYADMKVCIKLREKEISFDGCFSDVSLAKVEMFEILNTVCQSSAGHFSKPRLNFINTQEVKSFLAQEFKKQNVSPIWDIQGNQVVIYAMTDEDAVTAARLIQNLIVESPIMVQKESMFLLSSPKWEEKKVEIVNNFPGPVQILSEADKSQILIVCVQHHIGEVREMVSDFLTFNAVSEDSISLPPSMMKFLDIRYKSELQRISQELSDQQVQVTVRKDSITIKGTFSGMTEAKQRIDGLVKKVVERKKTLKKPGIVKYFKSEEGRSKLRTVEKKVKCLIQVEDEGSNQNFSSSWSSVSSERQGEVARHQIPNGATISVMSGDIVRMNVDVVVNACNADMKHSGGLAKAIVNKGGAEIQQECTAYVKNNGALSEGEVYCGRPGKLNCKMIIHACGPAWKKGQSQEREHLQDCVTNSLQEAHNRKYTSIAIPALCTGIFGYPAAEACQVIVKTTKDFLAKNKKSTLKQVFLCDVKSEHVKCFTDSLKKVFKKISILNKSTVAVAASLATDETKDTEQDQQTLSPSEVKVGKITVKLVKGQIAKEKVDIIVNTASQDLNLNQGAVSSSLLKQGGQTIQDECSQNYPGGVQPGEVAVTTGGNLKCKNVCHGALPGWSQDGSSLKVLQDFSKNCLTEASNRKYKSVSFPAMGTGNLSYPKDVVAKEMFQVVQEFSKKSPSVVDVRFVVYEKDFSTIKAFEDEFSKRAGAKPKQKKQGKKKADRDFEVVSLEGTTVSDDMVSVPMGNMELKIYQGDITDAEVDVIVNSTNADIDLNTGGVAAAIKKKFGDKLMKEIQIQKANMKKEGLAVTTSGGAKKTLHKFIIHVDATSGSKPWKDKINDILVKAEAMQQSKIALPLLGTLTAGGNVNMDDFADHLYEGISGFQQKHKTGHLKEIHVVIYKQQMLQPFIISMQQCFTKHNKKGMLSYLGIKASEMPWQPQVTKQDGCMAHLIIFADSDENVEKAFKAVQDSIEAEFHSKTIKDRIVKRLSANQVKALKDLENLHSVEININKDNECVDLYGKVENILNATDSVHKILKEAELNKQLMQEAELVKDMVQWYFLDTDSNASTVTEEEYPKNLNLIFEKAFRNNQPDVKFKDNKGTEYTINFTNMQEYPSSDPKNAVSVIRRNHLKDSTFDPPATWSKMPESQNLVVEQVAPGDKEYSTVVDKFNRSVGSARNVSKLERIQNRMLFQQYVAKKKSMTAQNPAGTQNERELWHGTDPNAVNSINAHGFNRSYCGKNAVAYGNGVYFAVNANYSASDTYSRRDAAGNKQMYLCKVLTGEFTKGVGGMRVPPQKQGANHILYDSVTNDISNPVMFIIFNDTQAYPEYLITFT